MNGSSKDTSLFNAEKATWLREGGAEELDAEQRALLLAFVGLEAALGNDMTEAEAKVVDALGDKLPGFDPQDIKRAMHQLVNTPADPSRGMSLSEMEQDS